MNIGLLVYPSCLPAGLFAFSDILMAANKRAGGHQFAFQWVSERGGALTVANGIPLATERLAECPVDAILVPGAWRDTTTAMDQRDEGLVTVLQRLPQETRFWSYCTGVCLVARTGRLGGLAATTTWWLRALVAQHFPEVDWRPSQTLAFGTTHGTAAGVHGYLPLALALLEEQCGLTMVDDIRRHMVLPRPDSQITPFQDVPVLLQRSGWLRRFIQWVEKTPSHALNTERLAVALKMSPRTLQRRTIQESSYRCGQLVRLIKLNQVGEQLISTDRALGTIADALGFTDEASLRRSFRQASGMTPRAYREQFGRFPRR